MALPRWVQGVLRPSPLITWYREDDVAPEDLTGATLTGYIRRRHSSNASVAIAGTLTVTDGEAGEFRWDLAEADVLTAGDYVVQFVATFGSGQTPAKTFVTDWTIEHSL